MGKKILGLDIGSATIKMALCKDGAVLRSAVRDMPEGLMVGDRLNDLGKMADTLRSMMKQNGIRARDTAIVVSNEVCFLRELTMPRMTEAQLEKNLPYEFSSYIEGNLKDYIFDYEVLKEIGPEDETMELMAAAIPEEVVEQMREFLHRAGLKLVRVAPNESAFQSLIRHAQGVVKEQEDYCFLNLGSNAVRMFMFHGERHTATRVLETGLSRLEEAVADNFVVERPMAHRYLRENYHNCQTMEVCMEIYRDVSVELMRALNFYRFSNQDANLENIWLCGGGSAIQPLRHAIRDALGINIHRADSLIRNGREVEDSYNLVQAVGVTLE